MISVLASVLWLPACFMILLFVFKLPQPCLFLNHILKLSLTPRLFIQIERFYTLALMVALVLFIVLGFDFMLFLFIHLIYSMLVNLAVCFLFVFFKMCFINKARLVQMLFCCLKLQLHLLATRR